MGSGGAVQRLERTDVEVAVIDGIAMSEGGLMTAVVSWTWEYDGKEASMASLSLVFSDTLL